MPSDGEQHPSGAPKYNVYRSRRGVLSRLRKSDLPSLGDGKGGRPKPPKRGAPAGRGRRARAPRRGTRRALKWVGLAALGWVLLSAPAYENVYGLDPKNALAPFSQPAIVTIDAARSSPCE